MAEMPKGGDRRDNHLIAKLGYAVVIELVR
jgi:hypothetical protein